MINKIKGSHNLTFKSTRLEYKIIQIHRVGFIEIL